MLDILTFRVLAGVLLGASVLLIFLSFRRPSAGRAPYVPAAIRKVPRALHGIWVLVAVLVPLAMILIAVVAPQLIYGTVLNVSFPGDLALQLAGFALFGVAGVLLIWSDRHLGRYMVVDIALAKGHELITTGPYAYVRHPTYTAVLLLNLATALFSLHVVVMVNFFVVLAFALWRSKLEEELLASEQGFGTRHKEYVQRTGRFLPRSFRGFE
ncbi:MAG: isoprenylcysteine carboxylmethyltransferase family protein [Thermoplasmata archaeon]